MRRKREAAGQRQERLEKRRKKGKRNKGVQRKR